MNDDAVSADAPGRVNLIGEHTDYHEGFVLPIVTPQRTRVRIERRGDARVRALSASVPGGPREYEVGREQRGGGWLDYIQGVTATLRRHGVAVPGFDVSLESAVPLGAGLSSSAALEVALLRALRIMLALDLDDVALARVAQEAEVQFVGAPVGIMDQMAASLGRDGEALFLDTRTLAVRRMTLPASLEVVVIDSGTRHQHAQGEYAVRRRESFDAAALLGVEYLRDIGEDSLDRIARLPPVLAQRARHVVTENARVLAAVSALAAGDAVRLGALCSASHASMRDDYEVSTPEIDALVAMAEGHSGIHGARLTGGGFGGAVVLLAHAGRGAAAAAAICESYARLTGRKASILIPAEPLDQR